MYKMQGDRRNVESGGWMAGGVKWMMDDGWSMMVLMLVEMIVGALNWS